MGVPLMADRPLISIVVSYRHGDPRRADFLRAMLFSFRTQTMTDWEAVVVHDGPLDTMTMARLHRSLDGDQRIRFVATEEHRGRWGHPWRSYGIGLASGKYIGLANDDGWYAPVYFELAVSALREGADFVYTDMLHNLRGYGRLVSEPKREKIDTGSWVTEAALAKTTPWTDFGYAGDGTYIEALVAKCKNVVKLPGVLYVHN